MSVVTEPKRSTTPAIHDVFSLTQKWDRHAENYVSQQKVNPFSGQYEEHNRPRWIKGTSEYAKPVGRTAERGAIAIKHVAKEMQVLCHVIQSLGFPDKEGRVCVRFGNLFERYNSISNKLVGTLIRARKHHLVDFPGEMLWQRRDDDVVITLLAQ